MPEQDAVVAITAHTGNMQAELNFVWTNSSLRFKAKRCRRTKRKERMKETLAKLAVHESARRIRRRRQQSESDAAILTPPALIWSPIDIVAA